MQEMLAIARKNRLLAGGVAAAAILAIGAVLTVAAVVASGGSSSAAPDETPTAIPTGTATTRPTATATRKPAASPTPTPTPSANSALLDGAYMSDDEWAARKDLLPLAVMFDNTPGSYPHSGLSKADLVYESFVEGGITRLMAVFWRQEADLLMPVRSARTPFVTWVDELNALYAHAGSAITTDEANASGQIREWGILDLDAFDSVANRAYYRDGERFAPYNLATSTYRLRDAAAQKGYAGPPTTEQWLFVRPGETSPAGSPARGIEVDFGGRRTGWQLIQWKWDATAHAYSRFMFGGPQEDGATGEQVKFTTVIVMVVPGFVANDRGHYLLSQFGEGAATIFMRGEAFTATWKKADRDARTRFYDSAGEEIPLERGPIFIEVLGTHSKFTVMASAEELPALPKYTPPDPAPGPIEQEEQPTAAPTVAPTPLPSPTPEPTEVPDEATPEPSPTTPPPASPTPLQVSD